MKSTTFLVTLALAISLNHCAPATSSTDADLEESTTGIGSETTIAGSAKESSTLEANSTSETTTSQNETAAPLIPGGHSPSKPPGSRPDHPGANGGSSGNSLPSGCRHCSKPSKSSGAHSLEQSEEETSRETDKHSNESDEDSSNEEKSEGSRRAEILNNLKSKLL